MTTGYRREVGLFGATMLIAGCMIGSGIFVVPSEIVQILTNTPVILDSDNRPVDLYGKYLSGASAPSFIHDKCARNSSVNPAALALATSFSDCNGHCLRNLGCRGPVTKARCDGCWNIKATDSSIPATDLWRANSCISVNAPCNGCVEKTFPGPQSFYDLYS